MKREELLLYGITDRACLKNGKTLAEAVSEAIEGGITMLQLREKELKGEDLLNLSKEIQLVCRKHNIPFIINDDVELAGLIDADGVHVGQDDMPAYEARKMLGERKIVGVTAKTVKQALLAEKEGADYLGSGALFGSSTKKDAIYMTMETFSSITQSVKVPVVGIGGINFSNAHNLIHSGASGIAVVSSIFGVDDIKNATAELRKVAELIAGID
ncbi:thiamine phosphate synthase [Oribacterium sp. WCC10]|uniref:thiamine phosphate synthase n=1 Tax=Oribacterium sp. WCC10 TaxID=1855343 RepID=UPI0008EF7538|nr:thiamine phosphate synthase [Oribacterium sp. WCC10]SFG21353.1 thiamine-phosphate pyrophosphorylase [Oribacterium sp. WCC10]